MKKGLCLTLLCLGGCASLPPGDAQHRYLAAIADAAVITPQEAAPLASPAAGKIKVVTWSKYPGSFEPGKTLTLDWGETWVTLDGAVQGFCRRYGDKRLGTQALLGLPPEPQQARSFVTLEVDSALLFRPCADPSLGQSQCGADFPKTVSQAHKAWYAGQTAASYQDGGFPWTRLGYTYNYNAGASPVGPTELVIPKGSQVQVLAVTPTQQYCQ
ncbi:hypothetical protein [Gallaecimonas xiamenensis]|uniref:Uncharacterized protein n=1 Tax=Gallaecimonas xiamenensis 3-C-1 TaxID=745411 RepID=K2K0K3_9GAMM|nr:hypothetical protein [Gallaecimonas xiamenensis]EKE76269.1 hypothetical protein B3C1_05155 [Gallaecimonas xiamenensis 3-C-1]